MALSVYLTGLTMGLGLIVAIGAQNAFVLRQGLRAEHVAAVVAVCALSDAVLIVLGVSSFAAVAAALPWLDPVMRLSGAAFLGVYAVRSLLGALRGSGGLEAAGTTAAPLGRTVLTALALTWLNPHVYLDTVVLLGTISTQFPGGEGAFAAGAATASLLFFSALGFGARWLRPIFANPSSWRVLDGAIALVMASIAVKLASGA